MIALKQVRHSQYVARKRAKRKKIMVGKKKLIYDQRHAVRRTKAKKAKR
jgi:hypothetical protein